MSLRRRSRRWALVLVLFAGVMTGVAGGTSMADTASAVTVPPNFQEQIVLAGLTRPTNIEFAADGRVFVAEQRGVIKVFDDLADTTPTVFADLSTRVNSYWDRGLLGLALAPTFPTDPSVYVLYTYDAPPGQTAPVWNDACGAAGTCPVVSRLARLTASGNTWTGTEQVLLQGWCQEFHSHSTGDLTFGPDGALYVSAGDGASFTTTDYGQLSTVCGDPTNEGGSLRSQDVRTATDPTDVDGALLRLNPGTGAAMPDNPYANRPDPNARRIVAYGMRNAYRFTIRPGTSEIWAGDVGSSVWEEINRLVDPTAGPANFGWPCYEGPPANAGFASVPLCQSLVSGYTQPYYAWQHATTVHSGDPCPTGGSSITGLAFSPGASYGAAYQGALFFADYTRNCIWAMKPATPGGLPDPARIETFVANGASPVDLAFGPGGDLYYLDLLGGTVRRVRYVGANRSPSAVISATPTGGSVPLTVSFNGEGSNDPDAADQGRLTYAWDFTNNGSVDSTDPTPMFTYTDDGTFTAKLTVTDTLGATNSTTVPITPGNDAPVVTLDSPAAATTWRVGETITFSGHATDPQDGDLPATSLDWHLTMQHCTKPYQCHAHHIQDWADVTGGSFVAPDHEFPSYLELELEARDSQGLVTRVVRRLDPKTVDLTVISSPPGRPVTVGEYTGPTPFTRTVLQGSSITLATASPQIADGTAYTFRSWSDGGARSHVVTAPATPTTYTATFTEERLTNIAANRTATSDSKCAATEGPEAAVNGTWTAGPYDKWCSKGTNPWLRVDLGSTQPLYGFVVRHAGAGNESAAWNTRDFTIQVSGDGTTWTTVAAAAGNTQSVTTHLVAASGRYARLNITVPSSNGNLAARIYEFEVLAAATLPPPQPDATNVALNKTATADSSCKAAEGPAKAVNGSWTGGATDKWCSVGANRWLRVDLGATYAISSFLVRHAGAGNESAAWNTRDFTIQVSPNGTNWTTVVVVAGNTQNVTTHPVTATGRYVRLNVSVPTANGNLAARIYELEVMGVPSTATAATNLALSRPATASGECSTLENPAKAVNGTWTAGPRDKWCTKTAARWLRVDLGAASNISSFVVWHAAAGGENAAWNTRDFQIQVSADGITWTTVVAVLANTKSVTSHAVAVTARYVRLNVTTPTSNGDPAARVYELEVVGLPA